MNAIQLLPILGLPLALLAGAYAIYRAARLAAAIRRGRGQPYSPPCTPSRENTITGTPARRELSSLVHAESRWRNQFMAGVLVVVFGWLLVLLVHLSGY